MNPRTVARRFVASYFEIGSIVLYGKYKNHHGKIVAFAKDKWGNPTIEVEPIPKGRKQNKVMGLFKIWRADVKEKALAELSKQAAAGEHPPEFFKVWADRFDKEATGLDLTDPEDRVTFRLRVEHAMQNLRTSAMVGLGENLGIRTVSNRNVMIKAIANAYIEGKRLKTASTPDLSKRVASRYLKAFGVEVGRTVVVGNMRIHRYRDHFRIWDLTNAGKRGKKVPGITLSPSYQYKGNHDEWLDNMGKRLVEYTSLGQIKALVRDLLADYPGEITLNEFEERGIDVNPGGTTTITLTTNTGLEIKAEPLSFMVTHRAEIAGPKGKFYQDTNYWSRSKKDAGPFYNWLKVNMSDANRMDIQDFRDLWQDMDVRYDSH